MKDETRRICPGCGISLPRTGWALDRDLQASAECWHLHGEAVMFEFEHPELTPVVHQLLVDTYNAQHAGPPTPRMTTLQALVGLCLALEHDLPGGQVRLATQRLTRPADGWPELPVPEKPAELTIQDVLTAGAEKQSPEGHLETVRRWAAEVWAAWAEQHVLVRSVVVQQRLDQPLPEDEPQDEAQDQPHDETAPSAADPAGAVAAAPGESAGGESADGGDGSDQVV